MSWAFQSTRPVRGATCMFVVRCSCMKHFNPRAPCGARPPGTRTRERNDMISIHAPRAGCDSRPALPGGVVRAISIHAPRAGRDRSSSPRRARRINFNPRAPCGAQHYYHTAIISDKQFQSTRPVRGATWRWISSRPTTCYFNPRAPCGARPVHTYLAPYIPAISIHAPRAGRDISRRFPGLRFWISIHAPRAGRDEFCL